MNLPTFQNYPLNQKQILQLGLIAVALVAVLVGFLVYNSHFSNFSKQTGVVGTEGPSKNPSPKSYVLKEKDQSTFFDAVLVGFDSAISTLNLEVAKNGYSTRLTYNLTSQIKLSEVVYETKTLRIISKKTVDSGKLKEGQSLRLFAKGAGNNFDLSNLTEIEILEGR